MLKSISFYFNNFSILYTVRKCMKYIVLIKTEYVFFLNANVYLSPNQSAANHKPVSNLVAGALFS